ncbi:Kinesin-like protein KIN-7M, chloroplastic [Orobanche minor]
MDSTTYFKCVNLKIVKEKIIFSIIVDFEGLLKTNPTDDMKHIIRQMKKNATHGCEFLLRVSYLEIYNEVTNDLLDPAGQNLRVREDAQGTNVEGIKEEVVLCPGRALSFIVAGEVHYWQDSNALNLKIFRNNGRCFKKTTPSLYLTVSC